MNCNSFSPSFAQAREHFHRAVERVGAHVEEFPLEARGPEGEELSICLARLGSPDAEHVLLHSSGLHGVEGFLGSALQLQLLDDIPRIPSGGAIVLIHVINPYGMAWIRRVNEHNVDLNRNFRQDGEFGGAPEMYHALNGLLNPAGLPQRFDPFYLQAAYCVLRHGPRGPKQAVGEGQYEYPEGLFYGGRRLEEGPRKLLDWIRGNLANARRIVSIDVHSGLGPYGVDSLLVQYASTSERGQVLRRRFGDQVKLDHGTEVAYRVKGGFLERLEDLLPEATWYAITQEYGTYSAFRVLKALRDENRYHHCCSKVDLQHPAKRAMLEAFCPNDPHWRRTALEQSQKLLAKASELAFEESLQPVS